MHCPWTDGTIFDWGKAEACHGLNWTAWVLPGRFSLLFARQIKGIGRQDNSRSFICAHLSARHSLAPDSAL